MPIMLLPLHTSHKAGRIRPSLRIAIPITMLILVWFFTQYCELPSFDEYADTAIDLHEGEEMPTPTLHLIGDSSMCRGGTNNGEKGVKYEGWGEFVKDYVTIPVIDHAVSGRSCRMYDREGRFDKVLARANRGDYVLIQFGRNEKGDLKKRDNGKTVCSGPEIDKTCDSVFEGHNVTVLTFGGYIANATQAFKERGVSVIIVAPTTNNPYSSSGTFWDAPTEWVRYSQLVAEHEAVTYVDHFAYGIDLMRRLGQEETQKLYPVRTDRSHTNPVGADMMARAFMRGLLCTESGLTQYVNETAAERISGKCT
ncbi:hypothetical protein H072_1149 [Dactylellina haptotyla CBS 200.50]|uniref:SGNH hydrolase-type esterase domain-containing protein n=1 Tax=Dactylellina haptotyla (strain CBS 200.50) TaxID=1284197 RepID=S8AV66_DACHA|nr:hypothetical protein H072_1149 [Dactylellina haptotyla CBS 200.50]